MVIKTLDIDDKYCCNIGFECLEKPVVEREFPYRIYESQIIEEWLNQNPTSPFDRRPLSMRDLVKPSKEFLKELKEYRQSKINMYKILITQCKHLNLKQEGDAVKGFYDDLLTTRYRFECGCVIV